MAARILALLISVIIVTAIVLVDSVPTQNQTVRAVNAKKGATPDASASSIFGKTPPPIFPGRMDGYTIKAPRGFPRITNVERMTYDPVTDSVWLAQVVNAKKVVYQVSVATQKAKAAYVIPGGEPTGNRWSGALIAGSDGTIWLGFGSSLFRKTPNAKGFVQMRIPPVTGEKGQVAGVTGMTIRGDELYLARHQRKELLRFTALSDPNAKTWSSHPVPAGKDRKMDGSYPQLLETLNDGRVFILFGSDILAVKKSGIYDPSTSELRLYPQATQPFLAGISRNRLAVIEGPVDPIGRGSNLQEVRIGKTSLTFSKPFPGVQTRADKGIRSGGFARDAGRGLVWFFMVEDRTTPDELVKRNGLSNPEKQHAFFVRTSLDERLTERYPVSLARSSRGGLEFSEVPTFFPMVTDKRGDLWAWSENELQLWHVEAIPDSP